MLNANPVTEDMIRDMAREARNGIRRIFLHWTGGHYGHNEEAYQICMITYNIFRKNKIK